VDHVHAGLAARHVWVLVTGPAVLIFGLAPNLQASGVSTSGKRCIERSNPDNCDTRPEQGASNVCGL
jgi:hypothetical protein